MAVPPDPPLNLLQRVDLILAERLAAMPADVGKLAQGGGLPTVPEVDRGDWVAGLLAVRGLHVRPEDVRTILSGSEGSYAPSHHEYKLVTGLSRIFERLVERGPGCPPPEGWGLVELFKDFTTGIARFRNNIIRRDAPWDSILFVEYPDCESVPARLDDFHHANTYADLAVRFEHLHPVRQAFRVLWLFARIAPFPDFNLTMAWVAMCRYLLHAGYPMLMPQRGDREKLHRLVAGNVPTKVVAFESRLLESLETQRAT